VGVGRGVGVTTIGEGAWKGEGDTTTGEGVTLGIGDDPPPPKIGGRLSGGRTLVVGVG
jgi:hypothetical protein